MTENRDHLSLGIPRHSHLLDWIEERKVKQGFDTLSDYFNSIKTDIEEALTLIDGIERYSPSSITQLLQVSKDKNFPIPVMIHQDQKIAFINHAAEDMAGMEFATSIIGQSIFSYLPVTDHPKMIERMGHLVKTGVSADPVKQVILLPGGGEMEVMMYGFLTTYQAKPAIQILFWEIGEDVRELRAKQEQLRLSECLNDALILLISDEEEEKVFPHLLKIACSGFRADKVKLFQNFKGQNQELFGRHIYEWSEKDNTYVSFDEKYQFFYYKKFGFSRWQEVMSMGECLAEPVAHMPDSEQLVLNQAGIHSVLAAPILVDQQFWGFISVDDCDNPRYWTTFEQSILKSLGLAISGYIQRRESSKRAGSAEIAMHKAQEIGGVSSLSFNTVTGDWYFSKAFVETFGEIPRRSDLFQKKILGYLPEADYALLLKAWNQSIRATTPTRISGEFMFKPSENESYFTYLIESQPDSGKIHGVFRDVTDSRIASREMQESQEKLERTQKIGKVGFWEYDLIAQRAWWSNIVYDMLGMEQGKDSDAYLLTKTLIEESDLEELVARSIVAVEAHQPLDFVQRLRLKSGKTLFFEVYGELIMDEAGIPVRISGTCKDISEAETAREKMKTNEVSLGAILESTQDLILSLDQEFRITAYNSSFFNLMELWIGEQIKVGTDLSEILTRRQRESRALAQLETLREAMKGKSLTGRLSVPGRSGGIIHYDLTLNPILGEGKKVVGVSVFGRDVTERIQKEREIKALNTFLERRVAIRTHELEKINKELETFAYSVSHDLRTPLRHLSGYSTLLMSRGGGNLDTESKEYLNFIGSSSRKMNDLIEDLLEYSRLGRKPIQPVKINLDAIVNGIVHFFMDHDSLPEEVFSIQVPDQIYADPVLAETVLTNLISNAVKYRKKDAPAEIRITSDSKLGGVEITVSDRGIGFDMNYVDQVFGIFKRLHSDEEYEGSGIGLANVVRIMHRHGGSIEVESEPGTGTTFTCFFPNKK